MFTGIIEHVANIERFEKNNNGARLVIEKPKEWDTKLGDSIAIAGVCLTVVEQTETTFAFDLMPETLIRTAFGQRDFSQYNIERAITVGAKLDGHMVSGHVDTVGTVTDIVDQDGVYKMRVSFDSQYASLIIMKGSVVIDGVSLTVTGIGDTWCEVDLVPYTLQHTTLGDLQKNDFVNLEFDLVGKYINRFMEARHAGE